MGIGIKKKSVSFLDALVVSIVITLLIGGGIALLTGVLFSPLSLLIVIFPFVMAISAGLVITDSKGFKSFTIVIALFGVLSIYLMFPVHGGALKGARAFLYVVFLTLTAFVTTLIDIDDWKSIFNTVVPVATLATLGLGIIGLTFSGKINIAGDYERAASLAYFASRYLLFGSVFYFVWLMLDKARPVLVDNGVIDEDRHSDVILVLMIAVPVLIAAGILLLFEGVAVLFPADGGVYVDIPAVNNTST